MVQGENKPWWCNETFLEALKGAAVGFILPLIVILAATILLLTGIDGEVKTILAMSAGWLFKSGYTARKRR
ncbi:MAG: hypothetical protein A2Z29_04730 [Chloroflexi bacterium RBG_16_56_11]|nr:MAG: hypothetical protein A2Z29_04730 [Chloroflexi bacterium RBG_16_56_11]